jgi:hypothetical protein
MEAKNESFLGGVFNWLFSWRLDPDELKKQADEYASLKIYKSYRGIAVLLTAGWVLLTKFSSLIHWVPNNKFIISLFIYEDISVFSILLYTIVIYFLYRGKKWAIIVAMILQTLNSGYALINSIASRNVDLIFWLMILFWWSLFMKYLFGAYKVRVILDKTNLAK